MTEAAILEAVRAASSVGGANGAALAQQAQPTADPQAVAAFQAAMQPQAVTGVPFADQVAATWRTAQSDRQTLLHRIGALSEMTRLSGANMGGLVELQYEVANLSFQQEIVTSVAKKASDAVSTLVKNG